MPTGTSMVVSTMPAATSFRSQAGSYWRRVVRPGTQRSRPVWLALGSRAIRPGSAGPAPDGWVGLGDGDTIPPGMAQSAAQAGFRQHRPSSGPWIPSACSPGNADARWSDDAAAASAVALPGVRPGLRQPEPDPHLPASGVARVALRVEAAGHPDAVRPPGGGDRAARSGHHPPGADPDRLPGPDVVRRGDAEARMARRPPGAGPPDRSSPVSPG